MNLLQLTALLMIASAGCAATNAPTPASPPAPDGASFTAELRGGTNATHARLASHGAWVEAWPGNGAGTAIVANMEPTAGCQPSVWLFLAEPPTAGADYSLARDQGNARAVYEEQCTGEDTVRSWTTQDGRVRIDSVDGGKLSFTVEWASLDPSAGDNRAHGRLELAALGRDVPLP